MNTEISRHPDLTNAEHLEAISYANEITSSGAPMPSQYWYNLKAVSFLVSWFDTEDYDEFIARKEYFL